MNNYHSHNTHMPRKASRSRAERIRRKRRKRMLRRIHACVLRTLVLANIIFLLSLAFRGGMKIWNQISSPEVQASPVTSNQLFLAPGDTNTSDDPLVVLDAGHGGKDQGTHSGNMLEKDINLTVAKMVQKELEARGIRVILTRTGDNRVSLEERAELANTENAGLFISIHCNYYEDSADISGLECYYLEGSEKGRLMAEQIIRELETEPEIKSRGTKTDDFKVLSLTDMPAVLIELGYLSNPRERSKLNDEAYQKILAEHIAESVAALQI